MGGNARCNSDMLAFRDCINACDLKDLGYRGGSFTWCRGNSSASHIKERLDRFLATPAWFELYQSFEVRHLPMHKSDHSPILLEAAYTVREEDSTKPFRFESLWLFDEGCKEIVADL